MALRYLFISDTIALSFALLGVVPMGDVSNSRQQPTSRIELSRLLGYSVEALRLVRCALAYL